MSEHERNQQLSCVYNCQILLPFVCLVVCTIKMKIVDYKLYSKQLVFKNPFVISHGTRTHTDSLFLKLNIDHQQKEYSCWGEATIPPYLKESVNSVGSFLEGYSWSKMRDEESVLTELKVLQSNFDQPCVSTVIEMAMLDALSQINNQSLREYLKLPHTMPQKFCSYTLSLSHTLEETLKKLESAPLFRNFKIKITGEGDLEKVHALSLKLNKKFMVDANQAFHDPVLALKTITELVKIGCVAVEQPLNKTLWSESVWLKAQSPIPIIADESFQNINDLDRIQESFHGLNIKTLKVGGVLPALEILKKARSRQLLIQVGCMSESSLGCTYALCLVDDASFMDLDGPLLISNDPFKGIHFSEVGEISLPYCTGIGAKPVDTFLP